MGRVGVDAVGFHLSSRFVCVGECFFDCTFMGSYPRFPDVLHKIFTMNG